MKMDLNVTYMVHILLKYFRFCFSTPCGQTKIRMSYTFVFLFFFHFLPSETKIEYGILDLFLFRFFSETKH